MEFELPLEYLSKGNYLKEKIRDLKITLVLPSPRRKNEGHKHPGHESKVLCFDCIRGRTCTLLSLGRDQLGHQVLQKSDHLMTSLES